MHFIFLYQIILVIAPVNSLRWKSTELHILWKARKITCFEWTISNIKLLFCMKMIFRTHLFSDNHMPAVIAAQQISFQLYFHQNVCWERGKWRESCFCRFPGMVHTSLLRLRYERCICYSAPRYVRFHPIVLGGKLFTRNIGSFLVKRCFKISPKLWKDSWL